MIAPMATIAIAIATLLLAGAMGFYLILRSRNMHLWILDYLRQPKRAAHVGPTHVMFLFVDHFEPMWHGADTATQRARVARWTREYRDLARRHRDADGCHPQHTFFYPQEEYTEEHLDAIASLCRDGFGEIEVHLHHDNDTPENFLATMAEFCDTLHHRHGALPKDPITGRLMFGFIHGNWCLDNSRPDGRWCGLDNELTLLRELGCYADFTLPSAPSDTQTATVNSIYYATDDPNSPKSHERGVAVAHGAQAQGDLMIVQGPLALNWKRRRGPIPKIENADIRASNPPREDRVDLWVRTGVHVRGRPDWVFVKVHTHGTQDADMDTLLGAPMEAMHRYLESRYNDGERHVLHYVTARETYNIIKAAEAGMEGNPGRYRDYLLPPPVASRAGARTPTASTAT